MKLEQTAVEYPGTKISRGKYGRNYRVFNSRVKEKLSMGKSSTDMLLFINNGEVSQASLTPRIFILISLFKFVFFNNGATREISSTGLSL